MAIGNIPVLDHGYVRMVDAWGSDERIIEAARMSTAKGFLGWGPKTECKNCGGPCGPVTPECSPGQLCIPIVKSGDEKLLRYLYKHNHATPFEMAGLIVEVQAPIFVFREWHRHRTQSYNEMSARYTPLPDVNYVPTVERLMMNVNGTNKQAGTIKGAGELTEEMAKLWLEQLEYSYRHAQAAYQIGLNVGIPKELARIPVPVGRYSRMRASANLRNWLAFLTLRSSPDAQWEIQQFSNAVGQFIAQSFPRTWELFNEKR